MSEQHRFNITAHPNIYIKSTDRELRIDFSTPSSGVNKRTGLLVFVPGFGGNIDSKVYKKMRETFADKYNMVTLQCDYFGSAYMQGVHRVLLKNSSKQLNAYTLEELKREKHSYFELLERLKNKNEDLYMQADFKESLEEFNDMSYMQAIDIITAIEAVKIILNENDLVYDTERIIGYGHSHGSYLLHLSNVLAPHLFSFIVDNSSWITPAYLFSNRYLYQKVGQLNLPIEFDYLAKNVIENKGSLSLESLYNDYSGHSQIIAFQGNNDNLVNHIEKQRIIDSIDSSKFILVTEEDIDNKKYSTNTHGLNADFLELFSYALEFESPKKLPKTKKAYTVNMGSIGTQVDFTQGLPLFKFQFN